MNIVWLVNPYGPIEGEDWREYSFNQFGKYLSCNNYKVIWWTSSFSHHFKKQRANGWKDIRINQNFIIRLVPTPSYKKNIGFGRILKDILFGINAKQGFSNTKKPSVIIASENPLTMGNPSFSYAKKNNIPIIYDQMDIWPEFIVQSMKIPFSLIANACFKPVYKKRTKIYDNIDGSIALGRHYLEFMQKISPSLKKKPNALIYNGIDVYKFRLNLNNEIKYNKVKKKKDNEIWCIFAGTLGPSYDIPNLLQCAKMLYKTNEVIYKFIIAGSGPFEEIVRKEEKKLSNVLYLGKLSPEELIPIYGQCDVGLATYTSDSNVDMPDKFYDYTAAGLAIINSLKGEIYEHIEKNHLGDNYKSGDSDDLFRVLLKYKDKQYLTATKQASYDIAMKFDKNIQNKKILELLKNLNL